MRVAIIGTRNPSPALEWSVVAFVYNLPADTLVVSGGAHGVDRVAELVWRYDLGRDFIRYCPDYQRYPHKTAPLERNKLIAADCEELHAWPNKDSRGTWHCANFAKGLGVPVFIHAEDGTVSAL